MASIYGFTLKNRKTFQGLDWQENQRKLYYNGKKVVWYNDSGNIYPGTINMWMKRICQTAGLEERTVHSLRHTNITM